MKKILHSILLVAGSCFILAACNNGEYSADPSGAANSGVNPLKPLTSDEFTWTGSGKFSADINGTGFVADTTSWYLDSAGTNVFAGYNYKTGKSITFALKDVYAPNLYSLSYKVYITQAAYVERYVNLALPDTNVVDVYASYLGNSGQVKILQNDTTAIRGLFYFQGITVDGKLVTVSNGAFNIEKPR